MEINQVERPIVPDFPKTIPNEQTFVYVPIATNNTAGVAKFPDRFFAVYPDGTVIISPNFLKESTDNALAQAKESGEFDGPRGPQGPRGFTGPTGLTGKSAYEIAVDYGFEGTEEEWNLAVEAARLAAEVAARNAERFADVAEEAADAAEEAADRTDVMVNGLNSFDVRVSKIEDAVKKLQSATNFIGADILANRPDTAENGSVYVATDNNKEYIFADGEWVELGDVSAEQQRISKIEDDVESLTPNGFLADDVKVKSENIYGQVVKSVNGVAPDENGNVEIEDEPITPQMYGAKGDGTYDDTEAFQSALVENRVVYVPCGTYMLTEGLIIGDNCELELSQGAVLNFTQTEGNCITLGMSSTLSGHHATIKVPYTFSGNVIYADSSNLSVEEVNGVKPWSKWDPQWKSGRYVTDINICKADSRGFHYAVNPNDCKGAAVYISANGEAIAQTFMWGIHYSGLRVAGAFSYGIRAVNFNNGWTHEMRVEAFIDACEVGVCLEDCNNAYISAIIQPRRSYSIDKVYAPYAKHGIQLIRSKNTDLSDSRVWDWDAEKTLWTDGGEYQHIAMIGDCAGTIINDFRYNTSGDTRNRIYTDTVSNLEKITIIQEPITRWFKPVDGSPYFSDGFNEKKLITQTDMDGYFDTDVVKNFTDVLETAIGTDGEVYEGVGYKIGRRMNTDGTETDSAYYVLTGFIPCTKGCTIYTNHMTMAEGDDYCRVAFFDANFAPVKYGTNNANIALVNRGYLLSDGNTTLCTYTEMENGFKLEVSESSAQNTTAYLRFVIYRQAWGQYPVISVDKEIKYTQAGFLADGIMVKSENIVGVSGGGAEIDVTATVGQTIIVKEVDENGKPTKWESAEYQPRTHWSEEGLVQVSSLPKYLSSFNSNYGFYCFHAALNGYVESEVLTSIHSIEYDGVEYTNLATVELQGTNFFGNLYFLNTLYGTSFENTGEPFLFTSDTGGSTMFTLDQQKTTHSMQIYVNGTSYHRIDTCYAPKIPVIDLTPYYSDIENYNVALTITGNDYREKVYNVLRSNDIVKFIYVLPGGYFATACGFTMSDQSNTFSAATRSHSIGNLEITARGNDATITIR